MEFFREKQLLHACNVEKIDDKNSSFNSAKYNKNSCVQQMCAVIYCRLGLPYRPENSEHVRNLRLIFASGRNLKKCSNVRNFLIL